MNNFKKYLPACLPVVLALLLGMLAVTPSLHAQNAFGGLVGTVTDSSGAVVPGASVTLTNLGTSEKKVVQSDAAGNYRFIALQPTQYKVEVEKTSYKKVSQSPITIQVDTTARADVSLQVGAASETIEVTTQAPLLQTESGSLGSQVEGKTVQEMPLNGRNVTNLIALVPGVVPQGSSMGVTTMNQGTHTNNAGWGNFQIGGAIGGQGSMYLDGAPLNTLTTHIVAFVPTQDAVQEFKVGTSAVSAEFGRFGGGVVEMATKGGTNSFHGTGYEFYRTPGLNANTWNPTGTLGKQQWIQQQYGAAVGGPVIKNKAFFFFSWEKFHSYTTANTVTNVPDAGMMSATNPSVPGNITGNRTNLPTAQQTLLCLDPSNYNSSTNRTTIPTACLDPTAQIVKNYFAPATNSNAVGSNNYNVLVPLGDDNQQFNTRGDLNLGKHSILIRYSHLNTHDLPSQDMFNHGGFKTGGSISVYPTTQAVLGDTITINQTTIADVRLSYTRAYSNDGAPATGVNLGALGFNSNWQAIQAQQTVHLLPTFSWSGAYSLWNFRGFNQEDERWTNTYALNAGLTKIKGAHTLKFGGQIFLEDINGMPGSNPGSVSFNANWYAKDEWANFLLGDPVSFSFSKVNRVSPYNWYQGYYATDTWNATRKLTITAGLRWELPGVMAERKNRATVALPDVATSSAVSGAPGTGILALTNSSAYSSRGVNPARHNLISPRFGVAYRLNNNTVFRAGYALSYLPLELNGSMNATGSLVNSASTSLNNPTPTNGVAATINYTASNPLNGVAINQPSGNTNPNFLTSYANTTPLQNVSSPVPTSVYPYMQQWNLVVGQQFKGNESLEVGYAGAIGIHLPASGNWNLNMLSQTNALALAQGTITANQAQALRPHSSYNNFSNGNTWNSTMTYHALQAKYTKRMGTGLITAGYTWSKSIGDTDTSAAFLDNNTSSSGVQNYNNHRAERSVLNWNITHRLVTSFIVSLPFGKGQKWLNNMNSFADRLIGGWSVNGITTLQSGQQIALTQGSGNNYSTPSGGAGTIRPDVTPGCSKLNGGSAQSRVGSSVYWFDPTCYKKAGVIQYGSASDPRVNYALGTEPRVDSKLRGPGVANWDFTLQKQTKIVERVNLQFRVEFFNIFNRRQFNQPVFNLSNAKFDSSGNVITGANGGSFGTISVQRNAPRQIQLSVRVNF